MAKGNDQEREFIDSIDGYLASRNESEWLSAIEMGRAISDNALLMVIYELATGSGRNHDRVRILAALRSNASSGLVIRTAVDVAIGIIGGGQVGRDLISKLIESARQVPGTYNALSIVEIADPTMSDYCDSIRLTWETGTRP